MRLNRRCILVPLMLVGTIFSLLVAPSAPTVEKIVYQRGYRITGQEDCALTLIIPKDQLPVGIPEERATIAQRTDLRIPVWSDGVTTVNLDGLYYANEGPDKLYACFSFQYALPEAGALILPYRVDLDSGSFTGGVSVGLGTGNGAASDADSSYTDAVSLRGTGPGERIDIYLDTAVFQAAEGAITFQVNDLNRLSYQSA